MQAPTSLSKFTDEQILAKLVERSAAFVCLCGVIFKDQTLYYLHRGCHNTNDPKKCSLCGYSAKDWNDFHTHFLVHKVNTTADERYGAHNLLITFLKFKLYQVKI